MDSYWNVNMPTNLGMPITPSWTCNDPRDLRFIANKPTNLTEFFNDLGLAALAYSGSYSAVTGAPNLSNVATTGSYTDLSNTPALEPVATAGTYQSLTNVPTALSQFENDLGLAAVALTGAYETLYNAPTAVSQFINDKLFTTSGSNVSQFSNDANYVPTGSNVSQLANNANYVPSGSVVSHFVNDIGYALTNGTTPISTLLNDIGYALINARTNISTFINNVPYATMAQLTAATANSSAATIYVNSAISFSGGTFTYGPTQAAKIYTIVFNNIDTASSLIAPNSGVGMNITYPVPFTDNPTVIINTDNAGVIGGSQQGQVGPTGCVCAVKNTTSQNVRIYAIFVTLIGY